jgi:hypothetical protein
VARVRLHLPEINLLEDGDEAAQFEPDDELETYRGRLSIWQRLRLTYSRNERWRKLNWAIAAYPTVASNYVLRGELLLKQNDTLGAISDFRRALELAAPQVETDDWGVVAQAAQDRALAGLRDALRRAARYNSSADENDNS